MNILPLVRKNILKMSAYSSARAEFKGSAEVFLDANENPFNLGFNRYPDPMQTELKEKIGEWKNIDPSQIMLGNGSDEIIDLLIRIFCEPGQDSIYTFKPGFGMYKVAAALNDVRNFEFALDKNFHLDENEFLDDIPDKCKIIFLCSPNNPTGNSIGLPILQKIASTAKCIIVIDEAYIDFNDNKSALELLKDHKNIVVLQTFSKALGGAGLRIGMAFSNIDIIELLNKVKMPYNVSNVNQKEALGIFMNINQYRDNIHIIIEEKEKVYRQLKKSRIVKKIYPSDANFLLVKVVEIDLVYKELSNDGIIVRNRNGQVGCDNCLRITIGTSEENQLLAESLKRIEKLILEKN